MMKGYRITFALKIFLFQFILSSIGVIVGYYWQISYESSKWEQLIYKDIKINDYDIGGKSKEEARGMIETQYISDVLKRNIYVTFKDRKFCLEVSKLFNNTNIDEVIDHAFYFGKDLSFYDKNRLLHSGSSKSYQISFKYRESVLDDFLKEIEKEIYTEPVNASIGVVTHGNVKVINDGKGYDLDKEKLQRIIKERLEDGLSEDIIVDAPVQILDGDITDKILLTVDSMLINYSTNFETSSYQRSNNIDESVKAINGTLLMPGEIFSFNEKVGERTKERGYLEAAIIVGNKIESGIGGGICQVSSTLYNAVLRAGAQIVERSPHTLPSSYVGLGLDATVDWGNIDFKFKNVFEYPMLIEAYTDQKELYINIYSNSTLKNRKYDVKNTIYQELNPTNRTLYDDSLQHDQNYISEVGHKGYLVKVIREIYEKGLLVSSEDISNDLYAPGSTIIRTGTKK